MVAYGFSKQFHPRILDRTKLQTVRAIGRKRHARAGERIQLYGGLRTKAARKLIADPLCIGIDAIAIAVAARYVHCVGRIEINGIPLNAADMRHFAIADGFADLGDFGAYWLSAHGEAEFEGVVIRWR